MILVIRINGEIVKMQVKSPSHKLLRLIAITNLHVRAFHFHLVTTSDTVYLKELNIGCAYMPSTTSTVIFFVSTFPKKVWFLAKLYHFVQVFHNYDI